MNEEHLGVRDDREVLKQLTILMVVFAGVCLLAGANRMVPMMWQLRPFGDVLRIREALSMFVFTPIIGVMLWLLTRCIGRGRTHVAVQVLMVLAVYFIACGMGMHDPADRMRTVYPKSMLMPEVWRTLVYLDDQLGHWVFFVGFVLGTWVLGIQQILEPLKDKMTCCWRIGYLCIGMGLLWVMLTNLWDEYPQTLVDLCIIALAAVVPFLMHVMLKRKVGLTRLPLLMIIYPVYFGSIAGTLIRWWLQGKI